MIQIYNLYKSFYRNQVLHNINLLFAGSRVYGIMGENGSGKSTLFRCIMSMESYDGSINIEKGLSIGYLHDTPFFYSFVTGMEYIEFCMSARKLTVSRDEIENLNRKIGLPLNRYASTYSLGMKKRLIIMVLMLQDNDIVIMDEPFNGLDLEGTFLLKQWIKNMRSEGKSIIISSHIISTLTDICDEIIYIHNGSVVSNYTGMTNEEIERDIMEKFLRL